MSGDVTGTTAQPDETIPKKKSQSAFEITSGGLIFSTL